MMLGHIPASEPMRLRPIERREQLALDPFAQFHLVNAQPRHHVTGAEQFGLSKREREFGRMWGMAIRRDR